MEELNQEQKKAVFSENKHTMVLAGAGTGKTKTILIKKQCKKQFKKK